MVGSLSLSCRYKISLSCLGCHSRLSTQCFSSAYTISNYLYPSKSKLASSLEVCVFAANLTSYYEPSPCIFILSPLQLFCHNILKDVLLLLLSLLNSLLTAVLANHLLHSPIIFYFLDKLFAFLPRHLFAPLSFTFVYITVSLLHLPPPCCTCHLPAALATSLLHLPPPCCTCHLPTPCCIDHLPAHCCTYHLPAHCCTGHLPAHCCTGHPTGHLPAHCCTCHLPAGLLYLCCTISAHAFSLTLSILSCTCLHLLVQWIRIRIHKEKYSRNFYLFKNLFW